MKIKAKYKDKFVYILGFVSGSSDYGHTKEKAVIAIDFYNKAIIESVDLWEVDIIDPEYIPKG